MLPIPIHKRNALYPSAMLHEIDSYIGVIVVVFTVCIRRVAVVLRLCIHS